MAFDYDGVSLPDDGTTVSRVVRGSRLLIVNRDPEAEQVLLDSLPQALLRLDELTAHAGLPPPQENPRLLLLNLEDDLPASIEVWPEMLATPVQWWSMIDRLRRAGVCIEFESDFPPEPQRLIPDDWYADLEPDGNGWFDLGLDVEVNGERIDLLPILRTLLADEAFPFEPAVDEPEDASLEVVLDEERVLVLPLARLRPLVKPIFDWLDGGRPARHALCAVDGTWSCGDP